jgi:subtilisin family serine protease
VKNEKLFLILTMKNFFVLISVITLLPFQFFAQRLPANQQNDWQKLMSFVKQPSNDLSSLVANNTYSIYTIKGIHYISLFGIEKTTANWEALKTKGCILGKKTGQIRTLKVPLSVLNDVNLGDFFSYIEFPSKIQPHLDKAVKDTKADSVQKGNNLPRAFTGKNVYIGITDWGFDYTHPMFYDTLLQTTRVKAAWDQYKQIGATPTSYNYGVEYDSSSELFAAGSDTANIYSYNTHGSHVAGIAGGSGAGLNFHGFAFESEFLFCTFLIDAASVIDGFNWMHEKATADGKRLVINMSWGLYYMGTLDGNSLLSQALQTLSDQGVVFVASAGNNGNVNFHIKKQFANNHFDSRINFYDYSANPNMWGQSVTMWGEENKDFGIQLKIYSSNGTLLASSDTINTATISSYIDSSFIIGTDTILFNAAGEHNHPLNNRPNLRLRVQNKNTSYATVLSSLAANGTVHYWNVTELVTGVGNWGMPFTTFGTNGIAGDANYSIGEPTCSPDAISVGAYASSYYTPNGSLVGGGQATFTSIGPLYTEEMKPDISAPGVSVTSSISSFTDATYSAVASTTFNGTTYDFARFSGTSMSSPAVAGIVALILDANPYLMPDQVKTILKQTARLDQHTGNITAPGNTRWGMGKVNALAAVLLALNTISIEEIAADNWLVVYPNPTANSIELFVPTGKTLQKITIYNEAGVIVYQQEKGEILSLIDCSPFSVGSYVVSAEINGEKVVKKFIKN